ncbi:MAG: uroporphyrinogen-III synthase, partial [Sphingomonadaceae bacterium]
MQVFVIRPEPGCRATVEAAKALGLDAQGHPLFEVKPLPWDAPPRDEVDAVLLGSANALRHAGEELDGFAGLPAYAVGAKTAEAAREADFEVVETGEGNMQDLLARLSPGHQRLLRIAGRQRVQLAPPDGVTLIECEVYSSDPLPMPNPLALALRQPAVVLLHSAIAAHHFAKSCEGKGIDRTRIAIAA